MLKVPPTEFSRWDEAEQIGEDIFKRQLALGGVGLSANQVGLNYRIMTMGAKGKKWIMFLIQKWLVTVKNRSRWKRDV